MSIKGTIGIATSTEHPRAWTAAHDEAEDRLAKRRELGQFLTPGAVADFMASLFEAHRRSLNLLDAGAGAGSLTAALVRRLCSGHRKPKEIAVTAYEIDPAMLEPLRATLSACRRECERVGVGFLATVHSADFIEAVVPMVRGDLFAPESPRFNAAIVNPPYRKIRSDSAPRLLLRSAGIEASNLYTGFLALVTRLLSSGAEMVAVTPRSFCNGPYHRPFREDFLAQMSLRHLHVFESRSAAFGGDDVLQENIVFHAVKSEQKPERVTISTSSGRPGADVHKRFVPYHEVVSATDPERFIHLVVDDSQARVRDAVTRLTTTLEGLGLSVSTGRVVDFRADAYLRQQPAPDTAPLIYPCHLNGGFVRWPKENGRKPNAIIAGTHTQDLLVPSETYVLVKRFTAKEERRRVVACVYDPRRVQAHQVGFENHLNYFHASGHGLPMDLAKGLAVFLNSTLVDSYFRQFNGHTQVNATDLRNLRYPTDAQLLHLGRLVGDPAADQEKLDSLLQKELDAPR